VSRGVTRWLCAVLAVASCRQLLGIDTPVIGDAGDDGHPSDGSRDARSSVPDTPPVCDAAKCAAAGGTCTGDACSITVNTAGATDVTCPQDEFCEIFCTNASACGSIDCSKSDGCLIACDPTSSCDGISIDCADGAGCTIYCTGDNSCDNDQFTCSGSGCDVECCGVGTCVNDNGNPTYHISGNCPI